MDPSFEGRSNMALDGKNNKKVVKKGTKKKKTSPRGKKVKKHER